MSGGRAGLGLRRKDAGHPVYDACLGIAVGIRLRSVHEALGVEPVGIDEAGVEHLDPEPELARHFFAVAVFDEIGQKRPHILGRINFDTLRLLRFAEVGGQRGVAAHAVREAGVVTVDRVSKEASEGRDVGVEPFGAVGGVGVIAGFSAQVGLKVRVDFPRIVDLSDEARGLLGSECVGEPCGPTLHSLGVCPERLPKLRGFRFPWLRMGVTRPPIRNRLSVHGIILSLCTSDVKGEPCR